MRCRNRWNGLRSEVPRGLQARRSGNHAERIVNDDGIHHAELPHRFRKCRNLGFRMVADLARRRLKLGDRDHSNLPGKMLLGSKRSMADPVRNLSFRLISQASFARPLDPYAHTASRAYVMSPRLASEPCPKLGRYRADDRSSMSLIAAANLGRRRALGPEH